MTWSRDASRTVIIAGLALFTGFPLIIIWVMAAAIEGGSTRLYKPFFVLAWISATLGLNCCVVFCINFRLCWMRDGSDGNKPTPMKRNKPASFIFTIIIIVLTIISIVLLILSKGPEYIPDSKEYNARNAEFVKAFIPVGFLITFVMLCCSFRLYKIKWMFRGIRDFFEAFILPCLCIIPTIIDERITNRHYLKKLRKKAILSLYSSSIREGFPRGQPVDLPRLDDKFCPKSDEKKPKKEIKVKPEQMVEPTYPAYVSGQTPHFWADPMVLGNIMKTPSAPPITEEELADINRPALYPQIEVVVVGPEN